MSAAWTTAVMVCATVAFIGIAMFMARVHREWWRRPGAVADTPVASATEPAPPPAAPRGPHDRGPVSPTPGPGRSSDRDTEGAPLPDEVPDVIVAALRERKLTIPVQGVAAATLVPSFSQARGERSHEALDILAPSGTPVLAVEDGTVAKLFTSKAGGLTIYQFDPSRTVAYYYAHLLRYADGVQEGDVIRRGQVIGYVGATGNADPSAPHLHFAIFRLGAERRWWEGTAIDPYEVLR